MRIEVKRTFIDIVDDEALLSNASIRSKSAPPRLTSQETVVGCTPQQRSVRHEGRLKTSPAIVETHEGATAAHTTVILRNIPPSYTRAMLLALLDAEGFACLYDFVYLPIKIKRCTAFGYAFINFISEIEARRFRKHFTNFANWTVPHGKCAEVDWSKEHQGLAAQVERYRDSPLMQIKWPDEMKPIILQSGIRVPFPEPAGSLAKPQPSTYDLRTHNSIDEVTVGGQVTTSAPAEKCDKQCTRTWTIACDESDASPASSTWSTSASDASESCEEQEVNRTPKKAGRSVRRIRLKLMKLGHNPFH